mmetsp:Transcript_15403/g.15988  ORF Transcript_15403/g.15988 Transcript_15403/m.15988 type:complete len:154 (+) Transcript_15403:36-497(+)
MIVFVKTPSGETLSLKSSVGDTVYSFKKQIQETLNIPCEDQRLIFGKWPLDNDSQTLAFYEVYAKATLLLLLRIKGGMQILIKTLTGSTIPISVEENDTILVLKEKIEKTSENLPPRLQNLIFEGKPLEDSKKMIDYQMKEKSIVNLVVRFRG